jgi:hypothetical protein
MTVDYIRYDILTQDALRSVVQTVLADAATKGLPGEHHFLISFDTRADGVILSPRLKAQYPKEMMIVLQHQFWDMTVSEDRFEVGLSFSGVPERLVVPFRAIRGFADPSVQFALQFSVAEEEAEDTASADAEPARPARNERPLPTLTEVGAAPAGVVAADAKPKKGKAAGDKAAADKSNADKSAAKAGSKSDGKTEKTDEPPKSGAEVVRLDRFRKK